MVWPSSRLAAGLAIALPFVTTIAIIWWVMGLVGSTVAPPGPGRARPALGRGG